MTSAASVPAALIFSYVSFAWLVPFSAISRNACGASILGELADFVGTDLAFISMRRSIFPNATPLAPVRGCWELAKPARSPIQLPNAAMQYLLLKGYKT